MDAFIERVIQLFWWAVVIISGVGVVFGSAAFVHMATRMQEADTKKAH